MPQVNVGDVIPIIVDPNHERFGQTGEMTASFQHGDGSVYIKFDDGKEEDFDGGDRAGVPQFIAPLRTQWRGVERLRCALPDMKPQLEEIVAQAVDPNKYPPTPETVAARAGFTALLNGVLFEAVTTQTE